MEKFDQDNLIFYQGPHLHPTKLPAWTSHAEGLTTLWLLKSRFHPVQAGTGRPGEILPTTPNYEEPHRCCLLVNADHGESPESQLD